MSSNTSTLEKEYYDGHLFDVDRLFDNREEFLNFTKQEYGDLDKLFIKNNSFQLSILGKDESYQFHYFGHMSLFYYHCLSKSSTRTYFARWCFDTNRGSVLGVYQGMLEESEDEIVKDTSKKYKDDSKRTRKEREVILRITDEGVDMSGSKINVRDLIVINAFLSNYIHRQIEENGSSLRLLLNDVYTDYINRTEGEI